MITAVSLNPSIDRTVRVERLVSGKLNRALESRDDPGGKGINVALAAKRLGATVNCIGILQSGENAPHEDTLSREHVPHKFIYTAGAIRRNIKIVETSTGALTEINQSGDPVERDALDAFIGLFHSRARESDFLALSGSLPVNCPVDFYKTLVELATENGRCCALDASGVPLKRGIEAKPFVIKPNRAELEELAGRKLRSLADIRSAAAELSCGGDLIALVSLGSEGAIMARGDEAWFAPAVAVSVKSTVGAGDAMLAGFLTGIDQGAGLIGAFRLSLAAAAACAATEGTQPIGGDMARGLIGRVMIKKL